MRAVMFRRADGFFLLEPIHMYQPLLYLKSRVQSRKQAARVTYGICREERNPLCLLCSVLSAEYFLLASIRTAWQIAIYSRLHFSESMLTARFLLLRSASRIVRRTYLELKPARVHAKFGLRRNVRQRLDRKSLESNWCEIQICLSHSEKRMTETDIPALGCALRCAAQSPPPPPSREQLQRPLHYKS